MKIDEFLSPVEEDIVDGLNRINGFDLNRFRTKDSESKHSNGVNDYGDCEIDKAYLPELQQINPLNIFLYYCHLKSSRLTGINTF